MKVLFVNAFPVTAEQIEKINRLDYEVCLWNEEGAHMFDADVVVSGGGFLQKHLEQFTQLKLIQLVSAGFDNVPLREIQARDIVLTNARGVYSVP
ncbi:MAG: hypothetical protein NUK65_02325, partial [Firmicutes bacterium]|nr:hypothetical protein [Bacillota bacterium]